MPVWSEKLYLVPEKYKEEAKQIITTGTCFICNNNTEVIEFSVDNLPSCYDCCKLPSFEKLFQEKRDKNKCLH